MKRYLYIIKLLLIFLTFLTLTLFVRNVFVQAESILPSEMCGKAGLPACKYAETEQFNPEKGGDASGAVTAVTKYVKYILGSLAVLWLVYAGLRIVMTSEEDVYKKMKKNIIWIVVGLLIVISSDVMVRQIFYGSEDQIAEQTCLNDRYSIELCTERGQEEITSLIRWMQMMAGIIAVLMVIINGIQLIINFGKEEAMEERKKSIIWIGIGIVIMALNKVLVEAVYIPRREGRRIGFTQNVEQTIANIGGFINWALEFIAIIVFFVLLYGAVLFIFSFGNDEQIQKAKKILKQAVIGIIIILISYALISTLIIGSVNKVT